MITSLQNQRIKDVAKLGQLRERRKQNLFVIEGLRELSQAVAGGYDITGLFVCDELLSGDGAELIDRLNLRAEKVSAEVFGRIAYRDASDGLIALSRPKSLSPEEVRLSACPFVVVLEAVEKPGNLGAILRTADAAGVDAVMVCDPKTDIYNPNVIRSSIGCVFTKQIAVCTSEEALHWLRQAGIRIHAAELTASECYHAADFTLPSAIVMGTEADGLTDFWLQNADRRIKIPMRGYVDSLNVSVSTAVLTFEAMRQRSHRVHS
jgi:TrmH family RNA methyltransferase